MKQDEKNNFTQDADYSLAGKLKILVVEWFLASTAHAIPNIFRTSNILIKIIWFCCLLASGAYCAKSMIVSLQDFLTYPTYISTQIIQEIPTQFPAVTICNLKTVNKTSLQHFYGPKEFEQLTIPPFLFSSTAEYIYSQQYVLRSAINFDTNLSDADRRAIGYELKDIMLSCFFNYLPCAVDDFTYMYDPYYGNCFTFNKGVADNGSKLPIKSVTVAGPLYGLILELYLGDHKKESLFGFDDGVIVSINNQSTMPLTEDANILASANANTDITINRNFVTRLPYPYGNCISDLSASSTFSSIYFDYIVKTLKVAYNQKYCFALCIQNEIINKCNCKNTFLAYFKDNVTVCNGIDLTKCMMTVINTFGDSQAMKECRVACPFECELVEYETSTSRSSYPTEFYKGILANFTGGKLGKISVSEISGAVAKVNVYYKSMQYKTIIESSTTSTETFFSNMGGTLGLYLGISLLSLVEVGELLINVIVTLFGHLKSKNRQVSASKRTIVVAFDQNNNNNSNKKKLRV